MFSVSGKFTHIALLSFVLLFGTPVAVRAQVSMNATSGDEVVDFYRKRLADLEAELADVERALIDCAGKDARAIMDAFRKAVQDLNDAHREVTEQRVMVGPGSGGLPLTTATAALPPDVAERWKAAEIAYRKASNDLYRLRGPNDRCQAERERFYELIESIERIKSINR